MKNETSLALDRSKLISIIQFATLTAIATVAPLLRHQMITGPIVNATLFTSTVILGTQMGMAVGLVPSIIALSVGTLPPALAPLVPYIMLSNIVLVLSFGYLKNRNYWMAVIIASLVKFLFLFTTSSIVINLLMKGDLNPNIISMMSYPQFYTALVGGMLSFFLLRLFRSKY